MTDQFQAATIRALYGAILTALSVFFATFSQTDDWKILVCATGGAFTSYMLARGVAEGLIDSNRQPTAADVGFSQTPQAPDAVGVVINQPPS